VFLVDKPIKNVVIVGGGSAGWLTAGILAAHFSQRDDDIKIVLIESPDVPTIGVGEGTWPSMRSTLMKMGISETDFIRECDVSFKQGSKFVDWVAPGSPAYYHPFTLPEGFSEINLAESWLYVRDQVTFADAVSPQRFLSDRFLAPKNMASAEFSGPVNYGYHLNAGKFSNMLRRHCVQRLGVAYLEDHVQSVLSAEDGDISGVVTRSNGEVLGDLFIDCSGMRGLLIDQHFGIDLNGLGKFLFNDSALAVQVPYSDENAPIESCTLSTAKDFGWIWDIGLTSRRGVGCVYSSAHATDDDALKALGQYVANIGGADNPDHFEARKIAFKPGYRKVFWHKNCVAVGMAAGFIEPLEATALVLVELSAQMIAEQLPPHRGVMNTISARFNKAFEAHWLRIVEFLKLHYVLSNRADTDYWRDHHSEATMPNGLKDLLELWRCRPPSRHDIRLDEIFPWASYQYILYGMGFDTRTGAADGQVKLGQARKYFSRNEDAVGKLLSCLPTNRDLLNRLGIYSFQKI
jgi:tryptophan 7-halogenase